MSVIIVGRAMETHASRLMEYSKSPSKLTVIKLTGLEIGSRAEPAFEQKATLRGRQIRGRAGDSSRSGISFARLRQCQTAKCRTCAAASLCTADTWQSRPDAEGGLPGEKIGSPQPIGLPQAMSATHGTPETHGIAAFHEIATTHGIAETAVLAGSHGAPQPL